MPIPSTQTSYKNNTARNPGISQSSYRTDTKKASDKMFQNSAIQREKKSEFQNRKLKHLWEDFTREISPSKKQRKASGCTSDDSEDEDYCDDGHLMQHWRNYTHHLDGDKEADHIHSTHKTHHYQYGHHVEMANYAQRFVHGVNPTKDLKQDVKATNDKYAKKVHPTSTLSFNHI